MLAMPFIYGVVPGANQTTSSGANVERDALYIKPGSTRCVSLQSLLLTGKGAGLTAISGIICRMKQFTSTASSGGTSITPASRDAGAQAAKATAAYDATAVTSGTGGPKLHFATGSGAAAPGGWVAQNPDAAPLVEGAATQTLDAFVSSGTVSLNYELSADISE